jgi:glycosyltransferase involved in cell wall biosynthesis
VGGILPRVPADDWVDRFRAAHGRPPRILHLGNIANNAYLNAKIQRRAGIDADAVAFDYYHIMGNPEWEECAFEGHVDEFFPDWWAVGLGDWERPRWFVQGPQRSCIAYLEALHAGDAERAEAMWKRLRWGRWLLTRSTVAATAARVLFLGFRVAYAPRRARSTALTFFAAGKLPSSQPVVNVVRWFDFWTRLLYRKTRGLARALQAVATGTPPLRALGLYVFPTRMARFVDPNASGRRAGPEALALEEAEDPWVPRFAELFPEREDQLTTDDARGWRYLGALWRNAMSWYDVVQVYATYPAIALAADVPVWTAYEHGTLRDIPFAQDGVGRITALGYREAPAVFVTNADDLDAAARLRVDPAKVVALPHAVDTDKLFTFAAEHRHADEGGAFFAPARHDWVEGFKTQLKGNDRIVRAVRSLVDRGFDPTVVFVDWGRHAPQTKELIAELGVERNVRWIQPLTKRALWQAYLDSSAVLDQFVMDVIGGVTFEAMALGRRVITALDVDVNRRFFGEEPPLFGAQTSDEIAAAMQTVLEDPSDDAGRGRRAQEWVRTYHSSERIVALQTQMYERLVQVP